MRKLPGLIGLSLLCISPVSAYHDYSGGPIVVNGGELGAEDGLALMQHYGVIPAGNYWYDPVSGFWGTSGGPAAGQIMAGLNLGGPLAVNASGGGTGIFVNGREIHPQEYLALAQMYGSVVPGRYWMNAQLIGGFEGGPAIFNLNAVSSYAGSGSNGGSGGGYNVNNYGSSLMSDGSCSGYLHPSGASVMTGNC